MLIRLCTDNDVRSPRHKLGEWLLSLLIADGKGRALHRGRRHRRQQAQRQRAVRAGAQEGTATRATLNSARRVDQDVQGAFQRSAGAYRLGLPSSGCALAAMQACR